MKQVIVVRADLNMGEGKIGAQIGHACTLAVIDNPKFHKVTSWWEEGMTKIVSKCNSEDELLKLIAKADTIGVKASPVYDAGITEVEPGTLTCCAFGPDEDRLVNKITGALKLL